jgi:regulatory factor X, other
MRSDWLRFVSPKTIVERELPCGELLAETILRDEVVGLLSLENTTSSSKFSNGGQNGDSPFRGRTTEMGTPPRKRARLEVGGNNSNPPTFSSFDTQPGSSSDLMDVQPSTTTTTTDTQLPPSDGASMTQGVLDQWAMWLCKLPERFPKVPPRVFLWCMESVGAGALRDITVAGGEGFGAWWVVRCWMDEWMGWIAEKGGFLDMDSETELTGNIISNHTRGVEEDVSGLVGDTLTY